ncbi:hypothetical protein D6825_03960 [Candidatus Woesearchaeota archaeon]|nr:MAG: hypothetical protein D6825_03960 [Candidatus Woesearchaeota archaeon]
MVIGMHMSEFKLSISSLLKFAAFSLLILAFSGSASAQVVIQQVLYDPSGSERGGEAVEIRNIGSESVDISGWILATSSSPSDATLPPGTIILPGEAYLVADSGWNVSRDNPLWKSADYEEPITLGNSAGGVALLNGTAVVDSLAWGDVQGLDEMFKKNVALESEEGFSLWRLDGEFVSRPADFFEGVPVMIDARVTLKIPRIRLPDRLELDPKGVLSIRNEGDTAVKVVLHIGELRNDDNIIPASAVKIESQEVLVPSHSDKNVAIEVSAPEDSVPGVYSAVLRVKIRDAD